MKEWKVLLDYIDYYEYSHEEEKILIKDGELQAKAQFVKLQHTVNLRSYCKFALYCNEFYSTCKDFSQIKVIFFEKDLTKQLKSSILFRVFG